MKTIKSLKEITTLEVGDEVVFGNLVYKVRQNIATDGYYLYLNDDDTPNDTIFTYLKLNKKTFIESIGIKACIHMDFPETKSLVALTAIVSALFKEYEKQKELPKTWDEFCERHNIMRGESYISINSSVNELGTTKRYSIQDRNVCTSQQEAKAFLALMQLRQLRKCYVGDWEPDWSDCRSSKFSITCIEGVLSIFDTLIVHRSMSFPNSKLAKQFFNNFKDLLEIAKPLL